MRCIPRLDRSQQDVSRINECSGIHCARRYLPVHQQLASARGVSMDTRGVIGLAHRYITAMQSIETGHGAQARSPSLHLAIDDTSTYLSADSLPPASGECGSGAHGHNHTGGVRPTSPHMQRQPSRLQAQHSSNPPSAKAMSATQKPPRLQGGATGARSGPASLAATATRRCDSWHRSLQRRCQKPR